MKDLVSMGAKSMKVSDAGEIRHRGFTLIELLVAMVIASIVMAGIFSVYAGLTKSYTTQNVAADVQQTMRATINLMVDDIMMAGLDPQNSGEFGFERAEKKVEDNNTEIWLSFKLDKPEDDNNTFSGSYEAGREEWITYKYDSALGVVSQCFDANDCDCSDAANQFIENVTAFELRYLNGSDEDFIDDLGYSYPLTAAEMGDIRQVVITIKVEEPAGRAGTVNRTYSTRVRFRNIGL
jgi:type IV pilus assembly protein PilW